MKHDEYSTFAGLDDLTSADVSITSAQYPRHFPFIKVVTLKSGARIRVVYVSVGFLIAWRARISEGLCGGFLVDSMADTSPMYLCGMPYQFSSKKARIPWSLNDDNVK